MPRVHPVHRQGVRALDDIIVDVGEIVIDVPLLVFALDTVLIRTVANDLLSTVVTSIFLGVLF
jgi:hypothetical protein